MQRILPKDANLSTMASSFAHEAKYSHRKALKRIAAAQSPRNEMQRKYTKMCVNDIPTHIPTCPVPTQMHIARIKHEKNCEMKYELHNSHYIYI